ncbi:MAG TPA: DMT family transporter [Thermohalobaculum sp.]|nr:DMT family transporter [Thermohalobaculum sp.]
MAPLSDNMRGAVYMMVCMAAFVINDALMKSVSGGLTVFQAMFLRGIAATTLVGLLAAYKGALLHRPAPGDGRLLVTRLVGEIGGTICFLTALFHMPIANATAILQSMPLAVTLGAALFLREPVGWRRYLAIAIGFSGVLVIVRPGAEGFNTYALFAVTAVAFMVLRDLSTRRLSRSVPSLFVAFTTAAAITLTGGAVSAFQPWPEVPMTTVGTLAVAAGFLFVGYLFNVMTMRSGEIGFVAPFRYTILIWAILLGVVVFGEIPDSQMLAGSAIVVGTGVYTFYREQRLRIAERRGAKALAPGGRLV